MLSSSDTPDLYEPATLPDTLNSLQSSADLETNPGPQPPPSQQRLTDASIPPPAPLAGGPILDGENAASPPTPGNVGDDPDNNYYEDSG